MDSEITPSRPRASALDSPTDEKYDDKLGYNSETVEVGRVDFYGEDMGVIETKRDMELTQADLEATEEKVANMSLERCHAIINSMYRLHEHDQNFPTTVLESMKAFLNNGDIFDNPDKHAEMIHEMKLEAILVSENSPYAEVRAVVDNTDDPETPSLTLRVWFLGTLFVIGGAFINQLFSIRQPAISVGANVAQLLSFPCGKAMEKILPDVGFRLFGKRWSLNPGHFSKKEHMLITIMANVGFATPYSANVILSQYLPQYFNQSYAKEFAYQLLIGLSTNYIGYGLAGVSRRFLVYPSHCVWPTSLVTIALNKAFHSETNVTVPGPFGRSYTWSRMKTFVVCFAAMFAYFWFPAFIFPALATFNWLSWIRPDSSTFNNIVGSNNGLGLNPWPTFDWNVIVTQADPLVVPSFSILNLFGGMTIAFFMIVAFYFSNAWNTGYLPINSNRTFDRYGKRFNVSKVIDDRGILDEAAYQEYSMAYMAAGNITIYFWFFAVYAATISYALLFHRYEISTGFKALWRTIRRKKDAEPEAEDLTTDIHTKLMAKYPEVSEWWFMLTLVIAAGLGMAGVGAWETFTTPAVVIYGIVLCAIFIIPVGLIKAITGIEVTLNVLAEFIGGAWVAGNALAMNYFKSYGYVTCAHAIAFVNDLKLAHYTHIPPWDTFLVQMVATFVSTVVCTGVFNFQMNIPNVCTPQAPFGFTCPGINTFFTAAVFWGTLGPHKIFGLNGQYRQILVGFPVGFVLPIAMYAARKWFPRVRWLRQIHPVMICVGGLLWAPYNYSYFWPAVPVSILSWLYVKKRYLAFWSKYNYVFSAALSSGIAIAAIVIFFALQFNGTIEFAWWGTDVPYLGCEGTACPRLEIPESGYFGPELGNFP